MKYTSLALVVVLFTLCNVSMGYIFRVPQAVVNTMATLKWRNHHFIWHNVRDYWNLIDADTKKKISDLGWAPPRPSQSYDTNGVGSAILDNDSGQDFLYMHRQMVNEVNRIIKKQCPMSEIVGWKKLPAPGDDLYVVGPPYDIPGKDFEATQTQVYQMKTDEFYWNTIKPLEDKFNDPVYLRNVTLGHFGSEVEFTVHNMLHVRFSNPPVPQARPQPTTVPVPANDPIYLDPSYDWSGDFFSAHVNTIFWKIHGWVDDRIEAWRNANGYDAVPWRADVWEGGPRSNISQLTGIGLKTAQTDPVMEEDGQMSGHSMDDLDSDKMNQVAALLIENKYFSNTINAGVKIPEYGW